MRSPIIIPKIPAQIRNSGTTLRGHALIFPAIGSRPLSFLVGITYPATPSAKAIPSKYISRSVRCSVRAAHIVAAWELHRLIACAGRHEHAKLSMESIVSTTPMRKKLAASSAKARAVHKSRLRHRSTPPRRRPRVSSGLIKVVSALAGTVSVSLAVALMTPSVTITLIATIVGLIVSGLLVKRYG